MIWLVITALAGPPTWEVVLSEDGWNEVATRSADVGEVRIHHRREGDIDCLWGRVTVDVPVDRLIEVAEDVESAPRWTSNEIVHSRTLSKNGTSRDFLQSLDIPNWTLVADRYWMLRGERVKRDTGWSFQWDRLDAAQAYPEAHAEVMAWNAKAIEPPVNRGAWVFDGVQGGTQVDYRACVDIGGSIPSGIQRWVAKRTLPDTMAELITEAKRRIVSAAKETAAAPTPTP